MRAADFGLSAQDVKDKTLKYMMEFGPRLDIVADRAEGMYIYDVDGREYLDFFAGIAVNSAGNLNPAVVDAIRTQAEELLHVSNYVYNAPLSKATITFLNEVF